MMKAFVILILLAACTPRPAELPEDFDATFSF